MRSYGALIVAALAVGCGGVKHDAEPDAAVGEPDAPPATCTVPDTAQSCGASCEVCPASTRGAPTCNGTACGVACTDATGPRCGDGSCTRFVFDFESNTLDDVRAQRAGVDLPIAVRTKDGSLALAIDIATPTLNPSIHLTVPVCLTDTVDAHTRTLRARVNFDGGDPSTLEQYFINVSQTTAAGPQYLEFIGAQPRVWRDYAGPLAKSQFSNTLGAIDFELGSYGAKFSGTVWVDDITIQ